jgi:hypothetical protein
MKSKSLRVLLALLALLVLLSASLLPSNSSAADQALPLTIDNSVTSAPTGSMIPVKTFGGSGDGVTRIAVVGKNCLLFHSVITSQAPTVCKVTAIKAARNGLSKEVSLPVNFYFGEMQSELKIYVESTATSTPTSETIELKTSGGLGSGKVTFTLLSNPRCSLVGSLLKASDTTTCTVYATKSGDKRYSPVISGILDWNFTKVTVTGTSGLTVYYTPPARGGNNGGNNGGGDTRTVQTTTLTISNLDTFAFVNESATLNPKGGDGVGALSFKLNSGYSPTCRLLLDPLDPEHPTLISSRSGFCSVTVTKAGDTQYKPQTSQPIVWIINPIPQPNLIITNMVSGDGTVHAPLQTYTVVSTNIGGTSTIAPPYGTIYFSVTSDSAGCTLTNNRISAQNTGTCSVTAKIDSNGIYASVSSIPKTFKFS